MSEQKKKKSFEGRYHGTVNLYDVNTLSGHIGDSFAYMSPSYGLRVEGIEDDANEWGDFWVAVAKDILRRLP